MIGQWQYTNLGSVCNNSGTVLSVYEIRIAYIINSQNISNNTSNITAKLQVRSTNSQYITYGFKQNSWINDTQVASNQTFDFRSTNIWQDFGTLTKNYSHKDDGTLTLNLKGNFQTTAAGSARPYTGSVSQNVTIPTISRNSEFTSVPNFNIGTSFNVKLKQYASFYDVLTIKIGSSTIKTINAANSTQEISFTSSELDSIYGLTTNASYADFIFELKSYTDSNKTTQVGSTDTVTSRGYIINSEPTITSKTGSATNTQDLTGSASRIIKYESIVTISVNFTLKNKATIDSVIINGTGATVSGNTATATFNYPSNNVFEIKVIDSRGFSAQTTLTLEMVNYIQLTLKQDIKRNQPTDGKVKIKYEGYYFDSSFGVVDNTLLVQYRSKCKTDNGDFSDWLSLTPTIENNSYSGELIVESYDYQKEYEFEIRAQDKRNARAIVSIPITKGKPIYSWEDDFFNVNGVVKQNNENVIVNGCLATNKYFSADPTDNFQTTMFDKILTNGNARLKIIRSTMNSNTYFPTYCSGLALGNGDTNGYLMFNYNRREMLAGGGNGDKLKWKGKVAFKEDIFPVGSIYLSVNSTNPTNYYGGTWVLFGSGRVLVGVDTSQTEFNAPEKTGGEKISTQIATGSSQYGYTSSSPSGYNDRTLVSVKSFGLPHDEQNANISLVQPYITCYIWKRTA